MTEIPVPPTRVSSGVTISAIAIAAIVPHEYGALIQSEQGVSLQIANEGAPQDWGDARINKPGGMITLSDIYGVIPEAVVNKFKGA